MRVRALNLAVLSAFVGLSTLAPLSLIARPAAATGDGPFVTLTLAENDNASDPVTAIQSANEATPLTPFADLDFSNPGYTFVDWNTAPDGSGVSYADGASYPFTYSADSSPVLYAIWAGPNETVTFAENDGPDDSVEATQTENQPEPLTLFSDLSPEFVNPGYTFLGWNTEPDGGGTAYADGENYVFSQDLVLYAQWSAQPTETISFNGNGGEGVVAPMSGVEGTDVSLPDGAGFSLIGHTFSGWNTAANGSGTEYSAGESLELYSSETLYAEWTQDPLIQITINANGGDGSVSTLSGASGTTVTLPGASSVSNAGFSLTSWNSSADGLGTSYSPGQSVTLVENMTLYAQWTANGSPSPSSSPPSSTTPPSSTVASSLSISFVADGGSGSLTMLSGATGSIIKLPSSSSVVRVGYTLKSWNTESNGKGVSYAPGASVTLSSSLTLYAQWSPTGAAPTLYGAIGDFAKNSATLSTSLERQVRALAEALRTKKYTKVRLYGYTAATGLATVDKSLSSLRAANVATYLRDQLRAMKVAGVSITAAGEGSVSGKTSPLYSRVEVFVS